MSSRSRRGKAEPQAGGGVPPQPAALDQAVVAARLSRILELTRTVLIETDRRGRTAYVSAGLDSVVGFAAFIYCVFLSAVAWSIPSTTDFGVKLSEWQFDLTSALKALAGFPVLVVLLAGETMARSRAGLAITIVALLGTCLLGLAYQNRLALRKG